MLEHFNTFHQYMVATLVHWSICGICGALTVHSHYRGGPMLRLLATMIVVWWFGYETLEMVRVADNGDIDVANGLFAYVVGAACIGGYHHVKKVIYASRKPKGK